MPTAVIESLRPEEAHDFWHVFVRGRTDLPHVTAAMHLDRYLAMSPAEQRTYFAGKVDGRIAACFRLGPGTIQSFAVEPASRAVAPELLRKAIDIALGESPDVTATYEDLYADLFDGLGFRPQFSRIRMESPTGPATLESPFPLSHPDEGDVEALPPFLRAVYDGHLEQAFGMHVGPMEEWRGYVTGIFKGETGTFLPRASWVARDDAIAGAILVSKWMGMPLVSELGVRADLRGRGLGRALLRAAVNALDALSEPRVALYVTVGNDPAVRLYESLGFSQVGGRAVTARLEL